MTHDSYPAVGGRGALEDGGDAGGMALFQELPHQLLKMKTASVESPVLVRMGGAAGRA
jgi:hypothetical protein